MTTSSPSFAKSLVFFTCHNLHVFLIQATTNRVVLIVVLTSLNLTPNIPTLTVGTCASQGLRLHFWCAARPKGVPDARGRSRVRGALCSFPRSARCSPGPVECRCELRGRDLRHCLRIVQRCAHYKDVATIARMCVNSYETRLRSSSLSQEASLLPSEKSTDASRGKVRLSQKVEEEMRRSAPDAPSGSSRRA